MIITAELDAEVITPDNRPARTMRVFLGWSDSHPLGMRLSCWDNDEHAVWTFARDLIAVGTHWPISPPGGDVRIRPGPDRKRMEIWLSSPHGSCCVIVDRTDVQTLLERTWRAVPRCAEHIPIPDTAVEFLAQLDGSHREPR